MKEKRTPRWVEVRNYEDYGWKRRMFVEVTENGKYICVADVDERKYRQGKEYRTMEWKYMRELEEMKLFRQKFFLEDL